MNSLDPAQLAFVLERMGCPSAKTLEMAEMLLKRASQLAVEKGQTEEQALAHLLGLMSQGWAAKKS